MLYIVNLVSSQQPEEISSPIFISILQIRKPRHRKPQQHYPKVTQLGQSQKSRSSLLASHHNVRSPSFLGEAAKEGCCAHFLKEPIKAENLDDRPGGHSRVVWTSQRREPQAPPMSQVDRRVAGSGGWCWEPQRGGVGASLSRKGLRTGCTTWHQEL